MSLLKHSEYIVLNTDQ